MMIWKNRKFSQNKKHNKRRKQRLKGVGRNSIKKRVGNFSSVLFNYHLEQTKNYFPISYSFFMLIPPMSKDETIELPKQSTPLFPFPKNYFSHFAHPCWEGAKRRLETLRQSFCFASRQLRPPRSLANATLLGPAIQAICQGWTLSTIPATQKSLFWTPRRPRRTLPLPPELNLLEYKDFHTSNQRAWQPIVASLRCSFTQKNSVKFASLKLHNGGDT